MCAYKGELVCYQRIIGGGGGISYNCKNRSLTHYFDRRNCEKLQHTQQNKQNSDDDKELDNASPLLENESILSQESVAYQSCQSCTNCWSANDKSQCKASPHLQSKCKSRGEFFVASKSKYKTKYECATTAKGECARARKTTATQIMLWLLAFVLAMTVYMLLIPHNKENSNTAISSAEVTFGGGDGKSESTAFEISTRNQLQKLADDIDSGDNSYYGYYFKLVDNITLDNTWNGIGDCNNYGFYGTFDGNGKTIIYDNSNGPLFNNIECAATIKNLGVTGSLQLQDGGCIATQVSVSNSFCIAELSTYYEEHNACLPPVTFENCYSACTIITPGYVGCALGGIVGYIYTFSVPTSADEYGGNVFFNNCYCKNKMLLSNDGSSSTDIMYGGLVGNWNVGYFKIKFSNCYSIDDANCAVSGCGLIGEINDVPTSVEGGIAYTDICVNSYFSPNNDNIEYAKSLPYAFWKNNENHLFGEWIGTGYFLKDAGDALCNTSNFTMNENKNENYPYLNKNPTSTLTINLNGGVFDSSAITTFVLSANAGAVIDLSLIDFKKNDKTPEAYILSAGSDIGSLNGANYTFGQYDATITLEWDKKPVVSITFDINQEREYIIYILDASGNPIRQVVAKNGTVCKFEITKNTAFTVFVYQALYSTCTITSGGTSITSNKKAYSSGITEDTNIAIKITGAGNINQWILI